MSDPLTDIPDRPAFKAAEVCEIAQIPPYVLRSWEKEFPGLGVASRSGGAKVYRRSDVEQVLRIKQLLFSEGLTLAGARRKLEGEPPPEPEAEPLLPVPEEVRTKVATVKRELRSLLEMLSAGPGGEAPRGEERSAGPQPAGPASAPPVQNGGDTAAAASPPPAAPATWPPAPVKPEGREETSLPLLNGTPDGPPPARSRKARRAKG